MGIKIFERAIELALGEPVESIRNKTVDEKRCEIEKKKKRHMKFRSYFPFIGRGNVLRDKVVDHEQAEKDFRDALKNVE